MRRSHPRALFAAAAIVGAITVAVAASSVLGSRPLPPGSDVALVKVDDLKDRVPTIVVIPELKGLDVDARRQRSGLYPLMGGRTPRSGDLGVLVVKRDAAARAFIALDPRNSCELRLELPGVALRDGAPAFHDVCHGSRYDVDGNVVGGPSPWTLDELVLTTREGLVYADLRKVLPGHLRP